MQHSNIPNVLFFWLLIFPYCGYAQTCCTGAAPLAGVLNLTNLDKGNFGFSINYDINKIEDFFQGNNKLEEDFIKRSTKTMLLQFAYSFDGDFSLSLLLPYVRLSEKIDQQNYKNSNVGDMTAMVQYRFVNSDNNSLTAGLGVKFPTGQTQSRDRDSQFILAPTLQSGTGSTDYILLTQGVHNFAFRKTLAISQSFYYRLNSNSKKFASHENYQFGNEFQSITSISDQFVLGSIINHPVIILRVRNTSKDTINTNYNENSGGTWLYISPKWTVQLSSVLSFSLLSEFPILRQLNGFQITTTMRVRASLNIRI